MNSHEQFSRVRRAPLVAGSRVPRVRLCALMAVTLLVHGCVEDEPEPTILANLEESTEITSKGTKVPLSPSQALLLRGNVHALDRLWNDRSVAWFDRNQVWLLAGGESRAACVVRGARKDVVYAPRPVTSDDGKTLYFWLGAASGLTAIDLVSGDRTSIARLPMHPSSYEGFQHYDPAPVPGGPAVAEASDSLILLLQEETNKQVPKHEVGPLRGGGHFPVVFDRHSTAFELRESPSFQLEGVGLSWAWSNQRSELYILSSRSTERVVGVFTAKGAWLRDIYRTPERRLTRIALSPGESELIVEHLASNHLKENRSGFVVLDVESGEVQIEVSNAWGAAWSPGGNWVAYLEAWRLCKMERSKGTSEVLAWHEPPIEGRARMDDPLPTWSTDGSAIAMAFGGLGTTEHTRRNAHTLLLDLRRGECVVLHGMCDPLVWSDVARPAVRGQ